MISGLLIKDVIWIFAPCTDTEYLHRPSSFLVFFYDGNPMSRVSFPPKTLKNSTNKTSVFKIYDFLNKEKEIQNAKAKMNTFLHQ